MNEEPATSGADVERLVPEGPFVIGAEDNPGRETMDYTGGLMVQGLDGNEFPDTPSLTIVGRQGWFKRMMTELQHLVPFLQMIFGNKSTAGYDTGGRGRPSVHLKVSLMWEALSLKSLLPN